jgi:hypothetical protein
MLSGSLGPLSGSQLTCNFAKKREY